MIAIAGTGGRDHAAEHAARLRHLADELECDRAHWFDHLTMEVAGESLLRIQRHRAEADAIERAVAEYDAQVVA